MTSDATDSRPPARWAWLLDVRSDDPVRRALNRGFAAVILLSAGVTMALGPLLLVLGEYVSAANNFIAWPFYVVMWHLNRRGTPYGAALYAAYVVVGLTAVIAARPEDFAGPTTPIPLILVFSIIIAGVFVRPAASLVALAAQMAAAGTVLALTELPTRDVTRFVVVGTLNLGAVAGLVMIGATMFHRALRESTAANAALRASEERYRALYEDSPSMFFTVAADGTVLSVNEFGASQLGYAVAELVGGSVFDVFAEPDRGRAAKHLAACVDHPGQVFHWEIDKCRKDETRLTVRETARAVPDQQGGQVVLIVCEDITEMHNAGLERARLEMELRQAHKLEAIGRLAGGTAHDFNNLLTVISGYTELLDNELTGHPLHSDVKELAKAVEQSAGLTRQLLAFSRSQVLQKQSVDLNEIVADMSRLLRRMIGTDVELVTVLAPGLGRVAADRNQLEQVILNLSVNARDAMPVGGQLTLRTDNLTVTEEAADDQLTLAPGAYVTLSVSDTGAGMDAETRRRVFEPFFTTKASGVGTGLGLSTVFSIVEQSQGRIVVSSEPYAGTTFTVYLPQTDEPLTASSVVPLRRPTDAASETVLLVEDEDGVRTLAARTLRQRGYRVFEARYAREALEIWGTESSEIDLLLTDIVMPGMSGVELAEKIAAHGEDTKIVLMSGYSGPGDAGAVGTPGQIAFLEKPFTQSALLDVVRKTLDGR